MDSRSKILSPAGALEVVLPLRAAGRSLAVVTGYFDPVLAEHARRLRTAKGDAHLLMAVITSPDQPILPARARAELVAALAVVDYVVLPEKEELDDFLRQFDAARIERQESDHQRLTLDLTEHVRSRQHAR